MILPCPLCSSSVALQYIINTYRYYFCKNCFFIFLYPIPSKIALEQFYTDTFDYKAGFENEKKIRNQAIRILNTIKKINPYAKTICDIGSGAGFFLDEAKKKKYLPFGIEPSRYLTQISRKKYSLSIKNTTIEQYLRSKHNKSFDIITLNHIIEHLPNPSLTLERLSAMLNTNGIIYIETPNLKSHLYFAEQNTYTFLTPPEHVEIFSKKSIRCILPSNLKIVKSSTYSYPEHTMGIIKSILHKKNSVSTISPVKIEDSKKTLIFTKKIKYLLFDQLFAPLITPLLNLYQYGSILELYIKKK